MYDGCPERETEEATRLDGWMEVKVIHDMGQGHSRHGSRSSMTWVKVIYVLDKVMTYEVNL